MGIFDGPFFDFNGDGKTDAFEFAMAMSIIEDIENEDREQENNSMREDDDDELLDYDHDEDSEGWL